MNPSRPLPPRPARQPGPVFLLLPLVLVPLLVLLPVLLPLPAAHAHPTPGAFLAQRLQFTADATNLDLSLELTFGEAASFAERRRLDLDRNGRIDPAEIRTYLREQAPEWEDALELTLLPAPDAPASDPPIRLPLALLHNPELDLRDNPAVVLAGHVLQLRFFARTPPQLRPGRQLALVNHLWAHLPATRTYASSDPRAFALDREPAHPTPPTAQPPTKAPAPLPDRLRIRCLAFP